MDDNLFDPITMNTMLQALPDIQQRQRRVSQLRDAQSALAALGQQQGAGNFVPAQQGGLYPTVQQWQPDYKQAGNQMMGAIGQMITNRQGNNAEDQLNQARNSAVLGGVQQASAGGGTGGLPAGGGAGTPSGVGGELPTSATMRAYLSLIGGPDMKDVIGAIPHVTSTKIDARTGNMINVMSNGDMRDTGIRANENMKKQALANGDVINMPSTVAGQQLGYFNQTTGRWEGGTGPNGSGQQQPQQPQQPMPAQSAQTGDISADQAIENVIGREGDQYIEDDAGKGPTKFGINATGNPGVDIKNLTRPQAKQIYLDKYWNASGAANVPASIREAFFDTAVNQGPQKAMQFAIASGGDPAKYRDLRQADYDNLSQSDPDKYGQYASSWAARNLATTGGGPTATATSVTGPNGGNATAVTGPKVATNFQKGFDTKAGSLAAEAQNAPTKTANEAQKDALVVQAKARAALKDQMPDMQASMDKYIQSIKDLIANPDLKNITGGRAPTFIADEGHFPGSVQMNDLLFSNDKRLSTARAFQQVKNLDLLHTVAQNRAAFGRTTNKDVGIEQLASNKLGIAQGYGANMDELQRMLDAAVRLRAEKMTLAASPVTPIAVEGATRNPTPAPADQGELPPGFSWVK